MYGCAPMAETLRQLLRSQQEAGLSCNVAHVHHLTGMSVDSLDALREAHIPVVLTLHDYWLMCPRGQMWNRREESCERVEPHRRCECLIQPFPLRGNPSGYQNHAHPIQHPSRIRPCQVDTHVKHTL